MPHRRWPPLGWQEPQDVARLLVNSLDAEGGTRFQANEPAGWHDVFHLHKASIRMRKPLGP